MNLNLQIAEPTNVLGVFGLSIRTQERDLGDEFSRHGQVDKVVIVYDQRVSAATSSCVLSLICSPLSLAVSAFPWLRIRHHGHG